MDEQNQKNFFEGLEKEIGALKKNNATSFIKACINAITTFCLNGLQNARVLIIGAWIGRFLHG